MRRWQYDEYYFEIEKEFSRYRGFDPEIEEIISRHFRYGR